MKKGRKDCKKGDKGEVKEGREEGRKEGRKPR